MYHWLLVPVKRSADYAITEQTLTVKGFITSFTDNAVCNTARIDNSVCF